MGYEEINRELERLKFGEYRHNNIRNKMKSLREQVLALESEVAKAEAVWRKEETDVQKFEKGNLTSAFLAIVGKKVNRLEKEKDEALTALMKYELAKTSLQQLKDEISALSEESLSYQNCEQQYEKLYKQKYKLIMSSGNQGADEIMGLQQRISRAGATVKELDEAISAGNKVVLSLSGVISSLDSAENWGLFDICGGDFMSGIMKHSRIDEAKDEIANVQNLMHRFRTELADLEINPLMEIEIGDFAKFADFFLDGFFADFFMQDKINSAQKNVEQVYRQANTVLEKLKLMRTSEQEAINNLKRQVEETITTV